MKTNDSKKDKCNPVIIAGNDGAELVSEKISQDRHKRLESAEPESDDTSVLPAHIRHGQALTDRYGKGIHRESPRAMRKSSNKDMKILLETNVFSFSSSFLRKKERRPQKRPFLHPEFRYGLNECLPDIQTARHLRDQTASFFGKACGPDERF